VRLQGSRFSHSKCEHSSVGGLEPSTTCVDYKCQGALHMNMAGKGAVAMFCSRPLNALQQAQLHTPACDCVIISLPACY